MKKRQTSHLFSYLIFSLTNEKKVVLQDALGKSIPTHFKLGFFKCFHSAVSLACFANIFRMRVCACVCVCVLAGRTLPANRPEQAPSAGGGGAMAARHKGAASPRSHGTTQQDNKLLCSFFPPLFILPSFPLSC